MECAAGVFALDEVGALTSFADNDRHARCQCLVHLRGHGAGKLGGERDEAGVAGGQDRRYPLPGQQAEETEVVEPLLTGEGDEVVFARAVSDHEEGYPRVVAELLGGLDYDFETLEQPVQSEVADQEVLGSDAE